MFDFNNFRSTFQSSLSKKNSEDVKLGLLAICIIMLSTLTSIGFKSHSLPATDSNLVIGGWLVACTVAYMHGKRERAPIFRAIESQSAFPSDVESGLEEEIELKVDRHIAEDEEQKPTKSITNEHLRVQQTLSKPISGEKASKKLARLREERDNLSLEIEQNYIVLRGAETIKVEAIEAYLTNLYYEPGSKVNQKKYLIAKEDIKTLQVNSVKRHQSMQRVRVEISALERDGIL